MNKDLFLSEKKLKELFEKYKIRVKKEKGQNFLIDFNIVQKLLNAIGDDNDTIVEIGSGPGNITIFLKEVADKVIGIEVDRDFFPILDELQKRYLNLTFLYKDIRKVEIEELLSYDEKIKIVGNIPYYLSSFIMRKLHMWSSHISDAVIMMPKDVADRIISRPGKKTYGILSVASQLSFSHSMLFKVKPGSFFPRPKIESVVMKFVPHNKFRIEDEDLFFHILNVTFGKRRKMLGNTLKTIIPDEKKLMYILKETNIDPSLRPEMLSVNDFVKLYEKIRYFS